jgi:hypothetical protein
VHQLSKANVSLAWYETQMAEQHGLCAICGKPETLMRNGQVRRLAADHNHCTGEKRGLLCMVCNTRLAWLENVEWRTRAEAYLVSHESAVLT